MGIATGAKYLDRIQDDREVWLGGKRVDNVTTHPALKRGAASMASLQDDIITRTSYDQAHATQCS